MLCSILQELQYALRISICSFLSARSLAEFSVVEVDDLVHDNIDYICTLYATLLTNLVQYWLRKPCLIVIPFLSELPIFFFKLFNIILLKICFNGFVSALRSINSHPGHLIWGILNQKWRRTLVSGRMRGPAVFGIIQDFVQYNIGICMSVAWRQAWIIEVIAEVRRLVARSHIAVSRCSHGGARWYMLIWKRLESLQVEIWCLPIVLRGARVPRDDLTWLDRGRKRASCLKYAKLWVLEFL